MEQKERLIYITDEQLAKEVALRRDGIAKKAVETINQQLQILNAFGFKIADYDTEENFLKEIIEVREGCYQFETDMQ